MKIKHTLALCFAFVLFLAACGSSGTGVDTQTMMAGSFALVQLDGAPLPIALRKIAGVDTSGRAAPSCTEYLTAMSIDVTASGRVTRTESDGLTCDAGSIEERLLLEVGTASKTADGWRFDFRSPDGAYATHYFGRLDGATLTIVRRDSELIVVPPGIQPLVTTDLSQLIFNRR